MIQNLIINSLYVQINRIYHNKQRIIYRVFMNQNSTHYKEIQISLNNKRWAFKRNYYIHNCRLKKIFFQNKIPLKKRYKMRKQKKYKQILVNAPSISLTTNLIFLRFDFDLLKQSCRAHFPYTPLGFLICFDPGQIGDAFGDAVQFGEFPDFISKNHLHVPDQLVDGEVHNGEIAHEPVVQLGGILVFLEFWHHHIPPLIVFQPEDLLLGFSLLTVEVNDAVHRFDGPQVHVHQGLVLEIPAQQLPGRKPVDNIQTHGH